MLIKRQPCYGRHLYHKAILNQLLDDIYYTIFISFMCSVYKYIKRKIDDGFEAQQHTISNTFSFFLATFINSDAGFARKQ